MTKLAWAAAGSKLFEAGVDRGVLYPLSGPGVPWNGLINVNESPIGGDSRASYYDGVKYYNRSGPEEFAGNIEAFAYPREFQDCDGTREASAGFYVDNQPKKQFGLSYRSKVGNDLKSLDYGYKVHLVYNALAKPTQKNRTTLTNTKTPMTFNWGFTTSPVAVIGYAPTAHFIVDSTKAKSDVFREFENIIYGTNTTQPRLPSPAELLSLFKDWEAFEIIPQTVTGLAEIDPQGLSDLKGNMDDGLYTADEATRLTPTATPGLYTLG